MKTRKLIASVLAAAMLLTSGIVSVAADTAEGQTLDVSGAQVAEKTEDEISGTCGDDLTWTLADGVLTISGTGEMYDYGVEEDYTTAPWRDYAGEIINVVIEDGVTSVGDYVFTSCSNLTSVSIADSVVSMGDCVFDNCESLTEVSLPSGITEISFFMFSDCTSLSSIEIPEAVTVLGQCAFADCTSLTSVVIPKNVTWIQYECFAGCTSLSEIWFTGDMPDIDAPMVFDGVTATVYYPDTWEEDPAVEFASTLSDLTWVSYRVSEPVDEVFSDVSSSAWYYDAVQYVYDNDIMSGTGNGKFSPNMTTTRAMVVQMLYSLEGSPEVSGDIPFTDVAEGAWYYDAVLWAYQNEIAAGISTTTFSPTKSVTREQFAQLLYNFNFNYAGYVDVPNKEMEYEDIDKISSWAEDAVLWACRVGIINGKLTDEKYYIDPQGVTTRAEAAALMKNFVSNCMSGK